MTKKSTKRHFRLICAASGLAVACLFLLRRRIVPCIFLLGAVFANLRNGEFKLSPNVSLQQGKKHDVALVVDEKPIMENVTSFWVDGKFFYGRGERKLQVEKNNSRFIVDLVSHEYCFGQDAFKRIKEECLSDDRSIDYYLLTNTQEHYALREDFLSNLHKISPNPR